MKVKYKASLSRELQSPNSRTSVKRNTIGEITDIEYKTTKPILFDLTDSEKRVLKILSHNNFLRYQDLIRSSRARIDMVVKKYYYRKPVIDDLLEHGIVVDDLEDMIYPDFSYELYVKSIPLLVEWLKKNDLMYDVKASIVRVLIDKPVSKEYAFDIVLNIFRFADPDYRNEWGYGTDLLMLLGNAFLRWVDDNYADKIFDLLNNKKFADNGFLLSSLSNLKKPENKQKAVAIIVDKFKGHTTDTQYIAGLISTLRKLKAIEARNLIEPYLASKDKDAKREAEKTISFFDKLHIKQIA